MEENPQQTHQETKKEYDLNSKLAVQIKKQIQFYFGDSNYPKDKFLRTTEQQNDGYIPISVLLTFNKLKSMSTDFGFVLAIIKTIEELEVKDDALVKRKNPLPPQDVADRMTVVVIHIPVGSELDSIEALESTLSNLGTVKCVRLPRGRESKKTDSTTTTTTTTTTTVPASDPTEDTTTAPAATTSDVAVMDTKTTDTVAKAEVVATGGAADTNTTESEKKFVPKRHAFVEFSTEEEAQKVIALKECEYNGITLGFRSREEFFEYSSNKAKAKAKQQKQQKSNKKPNESKKRRAEADPEDEQAPETVQPQTHEATEITILPGTIIEIKNMPEVPYSDFKAHFAKFGKVRYVEYLNATEKLATVRFFDAEATKVALEEINNKKMDINGDVLEARILEGEEEEKYWKEKIFPNLLKEPRGGRGGRGGRGRRGRGGRGRGRGRGKRQRTSENNDD